MSNSCLLSLITCFCRKGVPVPGPGRGWRHCQVARQHLSGQQRPGVREADSCHANDPNEAPTGRVLEPGPGGGRRTFSTVWTNLQDLHVRSAAIRFNYRRLWTQDLRFRSSAHCSALAPLGTAAQLGLGSGFWSGSAVSLTVPLRAQDRADVALATGVRSVCLCRVCILPSCWPQRVTNFRICAFGSLFSH